MGYECPICSNLLNEEPDLPGTSSPAPKRSRNTAEPVAGPSSRPEVPPNPEVCVPRKCGHMFHKACLDDWIRHGNKNCPICRVALTSRTLVKVFIPEVDSEEKRCENCEITKKTCGKLQEKIMDLEQKFLQETDKVDEKQRSFDELQERHRLLTDDIEEMTRKYRNEHDTANILTGRVASLEDQLLQQRSQLTAAIEKFKALHESEKQAKKELEQRVVVDNIRWNELNGEVQEFQKMYLELTDKLKKKQESLIELQERNHMLSGEVEKITKKYEDTKEKVASIEMQLDKQEMSNDSDSEESD